MPAPHNAVLIPQTSVHVAQVRSSQLNRWVVRGGFKRGIHADFFPEIQAAAGRGSFEFPLSAQKRPSPLGGQAATHAP